MVTISDIHGSKQYTLSQFMRVILKWLVLLTLVVLIAGGIFLKVLSKKADDASQQLSHTQVELQKAQSLVSFLIKKQKDLQENIMIKGEELGSLNEHLLEIEEILGINRELDESLDNRTAIVKNEAIKKVKQEQLSHLLIQTLKEKIPNGAPLAYQRITSPFGYRIHPITKKRAFHAGVDLQAALGTPIYAPADGVVAYAKKKGGYGNYILLYHALGFKTAYGHLSRFNVKEGDYVQKNDLIGYVGNTGRSTGAHLHYEMLYLHKLINPLNFMRWKDDISIVEHEREINWSALMEYLNLQVKKSLAVEKG